VVKISSLKNGGMSLSLARKIKKKKKAASLKLQAASLTACPGDDRIH